MSYEIDFTSCFNRPKNSGPADVYILRLHLKGNLVMELVEELELLIRSLITGGIRKIIVDLKDLIYIDSVGISLFIKMAKLIRPNRGDLVFLNLSQDVDKIFSVVKLKTFIKTYTFEKQAIDYLFSSESEQAK